MQEENSNIKFKARIKTNNFQTQQTQAWTFKT